MGVVGCSDLHRPERARHLAAWMWAGYVANRENLVPIATFLGAVTIAWAALKQARTASLRHEEQTRADRERRITESMAKAGAPVVAANWLLPAKNLIRPGSM